MKYAPGDEHGNPYVRTEHSWGREFSYIVRAASLKDAKARYGWTRALHTSIRVRRATVEDVAQLAEYDQ